MNKRSAGLALASLLLSSPARADRDGAFDFEPAGHLLVLDGKADGDLLERADSPWASRSPISGSLGLDEGANSAFFNFLGAPLLKVSPSAERAVVQGSYGRIFDVDATGLSRIALPTDQRAYSVDVVWLPDGSPMALMATETLFGGVQGLFLWHGGTTRAGTWQQVAALPGQACNAIVALTLDSGGRPVGVCGTELYTVSTAGVLVASGAALDSQQFTAFHAPGPATFFESIVGTNGASYTVERVQVLAGGWVHTTLGNPGLVNTVPGLDTMSSQRLDGVFLTGLDPVGNHVLVAVDGTGAAATITTLAQDVDFHDQTAAGPGNSLVAAGSYRLRVWEKGASGWTEHFVGTIGQVDCVDCCQCSTLSPRPDPGAGAGLLAACLLTVVVGLRRRSG